VALPVQRVLARGAGGLGVFSVALALVGPGVARAVVRAPAPDLSASGPGRLVLRPRDAVAVVVTGVRRAPLERVSRIERRDFQRMLDWASLDTVEQAHLAGARTPLAVVAAYDHVSRSVVLLLAAPEMLQADGFVEADAQPTAGSHFLDVAAWRPLSSRP